MFDTARDELGDALAKNGEALTVEEATEAISFSGLAAEQALDQHATFAEEDGQKYVVASTDTREFGLPSDGSEDTAEDDDTAAQSDTTTDTTQDTTTARETAETTDVDLTGDEKDYYNLNGIRIDVNPAQALAGTPTGRDIHGAPVLTNSHPEVPETDIPYYPVDLGERDTEDIFYRLVGCHKPIILEGEAGTGKNQLVASAASKLNLPMYRQEFGADTSVMDVVNDRDLDGDGGTYNILGKAAKTAVFGGVYVADEINMATGSVTSYLHPLFEDRGGRELELRGTGRTLHDLPKGVEWDPEKHLGRYIHPHAYFVGTCNPLHYADTVEMNDALRSRCTVIQHPYLATHEDDTKGIETEARLVADETGANPDDVESVVRMAAVLREARRESNALQTPIGHREIRDTVELAGPAEEFMTYKAAADVKMVGQASLKQDKQYIRDTIAEEL